VSSDVMSALERATEGMVFMSETDAPFQALRWKAAGAEPTAKRVLALGHHDAGTKVQELSLDEFLGAYAEGDDEDAKRYQNLLEVLREHLTGVRVFKVGRVNLDVYVLGRTKEGDWAGVQTKAVET